MEIPSTHGGDIKDEREIKLEISQAHHRRLMLSHPSSCPPIIEQLNAIFSRPSQPSTHTLRVRHECFTGYEGKDPYFAGSLTAKGKSKVVGFAKERPEIPHALPPDVALRIIEGRQSILSLIPDPFIFACNVELVRTATYKNFRCPYPLVIGGIAYTLEIDETVFEDGHIDYEVEIEVDDATKLAEVEEGVKEFFARQGIPFEVMEKGKGHRAIAHAVPKEESTAITL